MEQTTLRASPSTITCDPNVVILEQRDNYIRYYRYDLDKEWEVSGKCNRCGDCIIGAVNIQEELDNPVTPGFNKKFPRCSLKVEEYASE